MNREKYTLSMDEKEELTNIAIHEGFDKAFHRLMEIAVDTGHDNSSQKENLYAENVLEEYYHCNMDSLIDALYLSICKIHAADEEHYDSIYSMQIDYCKEKLPLPILEALFQFDFNGTTEYCLKLGRVCDLHNLIKEAILAVLWAYKSIMEGEDATYFYYNFFYAIPVKEDGEIKFIKLLYVLDESYNDD